MTGLLVYYSSTSEGTHRFVQKLDLPNIRLPIGVSQDVLKVTEPYVVIVPTYGGGHINDPLVVPKPVTQFLDNNKELLRGVIAAGNTNFGKAFCIAGDVISKKYNVPYLYRFELMGTSEDVTKVRDGLRTFWNKQ